MDFGSQKTLLALASTASKACKFFYIAVECSKSFWAVGLAPGFACFSHGQLRVGGNVTQEGEIPGAV